MRAAIAIGDDPRSVLEQMKPPAEQSVVTFGVFSEAYITGIEAGWKNQVHRRQWRQSLADHAKPLHDVDVAEIDTQLVLSVLRPIWLTKSETASRVRARIERILDAAKVQGLRPVDSGNPARFRGHLALLLPKQPKSDRGHHPALDWRVAPAFMAKLWKRDALSARALEFTILTAARSGETLGATWSEVDFTANTWTIPGHRMKAGKEHVVPLSKCALMLLETLRPSDPQPNDRIFAVRGTPRSNMAMSALLKRMDYGHITTHGFRSTFRDWAGDETDYPRELAEQALAHDIGNKAERAYRRGKAIEKRRELMEAWAQFLRGSYVTRASSRRADFDPQSSDILYQPAA
jgi:integrase